MANVTKDFRVKHGLQVVGTSYLPTVDIDGGSIDSTTIGGSVPAAVTATTLTATTSNLGTVSTGTWNGTAIAVDKGGTGATTQAGAALAILPPLSTGSAGKFLTNDGSSSIYWGTAGSSSSVVGTTLASTRINQTFSAAAVNSSSVDTSGNIITANSHGFSANQRIVYSTAGTIIGGLTSGNTYYVVNPTANTFQLQSTPTGTATGGSITSGGTGYTNGSYTNVILINDTGSNAGIGAVADITVSGGVVTGVTLKSGGVGYQAGDAVKASTTVIGAGTGFKYTLSFASPIDLTTTGSDTQVFTPTLYIRTGQYKLSSAQLRVYIAGARQFDNAYTEVNDGFSQYSAYVLLSAAPNNGTIVMSEVDGYIDYGVKAADVALVNVVGMSATQVQNAIEELQGTKATLSSPSFSGTPTAPTAAANTNTTQIATTAFVLGQAATATPTAIAASPSIGSGTRWAKEDHTHAGVTSATGTSNQVNVSASQGAVTFSLPQNIHTGATPTFAGLTDSGNLTFTGTGNRIRGDFSNATVVNRALVQSSTTNGYTVLDTLPNGTSTLSGFESFGTGGSADPANASSSFFGTSGTNTVIQANKTGTGAYGYISLSTSGVEKMRIGTDGNITVSDRAINVPLVDNDLSFDMAVKNNFTCTPTGSGTLTFTNITAGQSGYIILVNGSNYAISKAAAVKCASTFLSAISATGTYMIGYYSPDGTNVYVSTGGALS